MQLIPLGTNGFFPSHGRHTMCFLVRWQANALLLDAGTGVGRLVTGQLDEILRPCVRLEILLTHYHLDHVVGLSFLAGWRDALPVRIYAPGPPLLEGGAGALDKLLAPPLFSAPLDRFPMAVSVSEITERRLSLGGLEVRLRRQEHPGGSVGVRLGDRLAYVTDTIATPETATFVNGVDLLLHEVWLTNQGAESEDAASHGHSSAREVVSLVREAGVRRLMPVHHHPLWPPPALPELERDLEPSGCEILLPEEGRVYDV